MSNDELTPKPREAVPPVENTLPADDALPTDVALPTDLTLPADLAAFEAQLAGLVPQSNLDRDRLLFAAGKAAALAELQPPVEPARASMVWKAMAIGFASLAAVLALMLVVQSEANLAVAPTSPPGAGSAIQIAPAPTPAAEIAPDAIATVTETSTDVPRYLAARSAALTGNWQAFEDPTRVAATLPPSASYHDLRMRLLPENQP